MKASTQTPVAFARFRAWLVIAIVLSVVASGASAAPIYSMTGVAVASNDCGNALACVTAGVGVSNASRAANNILTDYATMYKGLSLGSTVALRLGVVSGTGQTGKAGDRAGVLVASGPGLLALSTLGTYTINTYLNNSATPQESHVVSAAVVQSLALLSSGSRPTQLEFVAKLPFDAVELRIDGTASLLYTLNVYYAYAVPSLIQPQVKGALSQFATSGSGLQPYYGAGTSNVGIVSACVGTGVQNPEMAVDYDLTNYAQFTSVASVGCPPALAVRLAVNQPVPAGYYAGFVIGNSGLLDLSVLSGLKVSTCLNGVFVGQSSVTNLLELRALPDGKYQVSFPTTAAFNEVKIERTGAVTLLDNLRIYYGFGVEPTAFQAATHVFSNFATPPASSYEVAGNAVLCVAAGNCTVTNAAFAADANLTNYASINSAVALASTAELKLSLNTSTATAANGGNVGAAGNRAGVVVGTGAGLLDATALSRLTISTYDANDNLLESASGSALLGLNVLSSTTQEVSFLTTQPFAKVQLSVSSGVAIASNIAVYYAFADDRTGGLPSVIIPLPVELVSFTGKWLNGAAELNWATATEKNSSSFVVERSTGSDAAFRSVGQVAAAGNSSSLKTYKLRDAEAGAQGVAVLYYRLRQVDIDGKEAFSPVVSLAVGKAMAVAPQLEVYPNPSADAQAVMVNCPNLPATGGSVQTYSQLGQLVSQMTLTESSSRLALPALAPGLYYVVLRDAGGQQLATQRLVVESR